MIVKASDVEGFKSPDSHPRIMQYLVRRDNTGVQSFVMGVTTLTPGCETPIAQHVDEEAYYILEGTLDVDIGDERGQAGPDTAVFIPSNVRHQIRNNGSIPVRFTWVMTPHPEEINVRPGWRVVSMKENDQAGKPRERQGSRQIIFTEKAPKPTPGNSSQGVRIGNLVYTAGQVAINPATGQVETDDFEAQTQRVLDNLKAILEAAGTSLDNAVKISVYLKDIRDMAKLNAIYQTYFHGAPPARSVTQAGDLRERCLVYMEAIASVS